MKQDLEAGKDAVKIAAMKSVLAQMLNGRLDYHFQAPSNIVSEASSGRL